MLRTLFSFLPRTVVTVAAVLHFFINGRKRKRQIFDVEESKVEQKPFKTSLNYIRDNTVP